jgi:RNA polymerase sigma-70 factor (ECF subfamily)
MPAFTRLPAQRLKLLGRAAPFSAERPETVGTTACPWYQRGVRAPEPKADARLLAVQALSHLDALYGFALRLSRNAHVAEDLVQDTLFRCLARGESFIVGTDLKAWLFRILRNAFIDLRRREARGPLRTMADAPETSCALPATPADVDLDQLRRLVARDIDAALQSLSDDHRMVVLLDLEGFSEQEIADVMECAPGTVKSRLARARAALRAQLREYAR